MSKMNRFIFLGFLYFLNTVTVDGQNGTEEYDPTTGKLLFLHTIWRHGTRAPHGTYPNSVYNETTFYPGYGELLALGMAEQFILGGQLRQRYVTGMNFMSRTPDISEIHVRSSDYNRTILSAICNFYGFYSPSATEGKDYPGNTRWPRGLIPVPVHTVPYDTDTIFNQNACPVQAQLQNLSMETPGYLGLIDNYTEFFEILANKSGLDTSTLDGKGTIVDALSSEDAMGLQMTDWGRASLSEAIQFWSTVFSRSVGMGVEDYKNITLKEELAKGSGGPILTEIVNRMNEKLENYLNSSTSSWIRQLKYYSYSGHDTTLLSLFSTFGIQRSDINSDNPILPSSTICVELWVDINNNTDVKVLYLRRNATLFQDITPIITGCEQGCSLSQFTNRSIPYMWEDPDFCNYQYDISG
ncbi:hypothetical protein FO519_006240 [Halicephalobus sp. NKZ332]|nr:hypothetical protein FO519_006240 [Halicephalobus sp. NKZ332]